MKHETDSSHPSMKHEPAGPTVSVLMPVYNAEAYLAEALDSVLTQTFGDFECICVDDGSTDGSLNMLRAYEQRDPRVRVISRPNTGIVGALNDGLAAARGPLIARMDADDWCAPERFAKQLAYLEAHPDCIAVGTWVQRTDPYGSPAGRQEPPTTHEAIDAALLTGDGAVMVHATLLMRADTLRAIDGWRPAHNWVEDFDLFLRLGEVGRLANLPEYLYSYRRHLESVCVRHAELMRHQLKEVLREAYLRRGRDDFPDPAVIRPELAVKQPAAEVYRNWACHALHAGNIRLARQHATQALRRTPLSLRSWRVMYWAISA